MSTDLSDLVKTIRPSDIETWGYASVRLRVVSELGW